MEQAKRIWRSINEISLLDYMINNSLEGISGLSENLHEASKSHGSMDDRTINMVIDNQNQTIACTKDYEEQLNRWLNENPTQKQREQIQNLKEKNNCVLKQAKKNLKIAEKMKDTTIESILGRSDGQVAIDTLSGRLIEPDKKYLPDLTKTALTQEQIEKGKKIDTAVRKIIKKDNDVGDETMLLEMGPYMNDFKSLMNSASSDDFNALCLNYGGLFVYAKFLEGIAQGIKDGEYPI